MPRLVQPESLRDLSVAKAGRLIFGSWAAIEREYGVNTAAEWSALQQTKVATLRAFLLSHIRPVLDEVCGAMCRVHVIPNQAKGKECHPESKDVRILISLMIHDQIKVLHFGHEFHKRLFLNVSLSESQIEQLENLVELDIPGFPLTDKMLEGIGRTCEHLEKINIACNPKYGTLESMRNLLKCRKLEYVQVSFNGWKGTQCRPYIAMLLTELPNIKTYNDIGSMDIEKILCELTSVTSLQELDVGAITGKDFASIIQKCPQLKHLRISPLNFCEGCDSLASLAESAPLETAHFDGFRFERYMIRMLERKGANLTKLVIENCEGPEINMDDIYAIGANCPALETLAIFESRRGKYIDDPPHRCRLLCDKQRVAKRPWMFRRLTLANLNSAWGWDFRVVLQVILNADRLTTLVLVNVFANGRRDILEEILEANPLSELESMSLEADRWFVKANPESPPVSLQSLRRLLERCPGLASLRLASAMEPDAVALARRLQSDAWGENRDLCVSCSDPAESSDESDDFDASAHDDDFQKYLAEYEENSALALL